jgi:hypothetical protein
MASKRNSGALYTALGGGVAIGTDIDAAMMNSLGHQWIAIGDGIGTALGTAAGTIYYLIKFKHKEFRNASRRSDLFEIGTD